MEEVIYHSAAEQQSSQKKMSSEGDHLFFYSYPISRRLCFDNQEEEPDLRPSESAAPAAQNDGGWTGFRRSTIATFFEGELVVNENRPVF